jgi:hypothetical protein
VVLPPAAIATALRSFEASGIGAAVVGEVVESTGSSGRYIEGPLESIA